MNALAYVIAVLNPLLLITWCAIYETIIIFSIFYLSFNNFIGLIAVIVEAYGIGLPTGVLITAMQFENTKDVVVRLGPIHTLADEITALHLPPEAFKYIPYYRNEHEGIYLSKNLWNFLRHGEGDRSEEGTILTLDFQSNSLNPPNQPDPLAYLLHPYDFSDADMKKVDQYIQNLHKNRKLRSIHTLIP